MFGFVVAVCILICVTVLFSFTYGGVVSYIKYCYTF